MGRRGYFGKDGSDWESWQRRNWEPLLDSMRRACRQSAQRPSRGLAAGAVSEAVITYLNNLENQSGLGGSAGAAGGAGGLGVPDRWFLVGVFGFVFCGGGFLVLFGNAGAGFTREG